MLLPGERVSFARFRRASRTEQAIREALNVGVDRKAAKTSNVIATKALACKLAKAGWHLMTEGTEYEAQRMFGQPARSK